MILSRLKKTIESVILAASIAMAPMAAKADTEKEYMRGAPSHTQWAIDNKDSARAMVLGANVAFNCLKSGIGSKVNGKGFWEGCAKGAFAGTITFAGEYVATYNNYPMVGAAGKLINDLGVSISDNVMRGEDMFSQYQTELGPLTLTFRDSVVPHPSFTLTPAFAIARNLFWGQKFDARQSLYNLTPVFSMPLLRGDLTPYSVLAGYTTGNVISYTPMRDTSNMALSHEFNHALFWSRTRFCGDLLYPIPYAKEVEEYWNVGQDICDSLSVAPMYLNRGWYYYEMPEIEAHIMQRK